MPSKQIKKIAWNFGGSTRVFKASQFQYSAQADREEWILANRNAEFNQPNIRLFFSVFAEDMKSQIFGTNTGFVDLLNAVDDPTVTVLFYPVWEDGAGNADTTNYEVVPDYKKVALMQAKRAGVFNHGMDLNMKTKQGDYSSYPSWANFK